MRLSFFVIPALFAGVALTQSGPVGGLSPIPVLPQGGLVPFDSSQYVFLGPTIREVTLSFPERLAEGEHNGPRTVHRFELVNQVAPSVRATVASGPDGTYTYSYLVENGAGAPKAIKTWSLGTPSSNAVISAQHPTWAAATEGLPEAPEGALSAARPVSYITWRPSNGLAVEPGLAVPEFRVSSSYSPGFTLAYARSADEFVLPDDLPEEVAGQLAVLYQPEWFNKSCLTIGPRYPTEWSKQFIAADFSYGIERLTRTGDLDADSPFVTEALASLRVFLGTQGAATTPPLSFLGRAETALERSIASAIQISLQ